MINFKKKTWYNKNDLANADKRIPVNATNLNRIEEGIQESFEEIAYANLKNLVIQKITSSCTWTAPKAVKNMFKIFCVGGGGGGGIDIIEGDYVHDVIAGAGGGGGGHIVISELTIPHSTEVQVVCGAGGACDTNGGNSMFGDIIANGGEKGKPVDYSIDSRALYGGRGGDGGAGGGGGSVYSSYKYHPFSSTIMSGAGGNADLCGGGGAGCIRAEGGIAATAGNPGSLGGCGGAQGAINNPSSKFANASFVDTLFDTELMLIGNSTSTIDPKEKAGAGGRGGTGGVDPEPSNSAKNGGAGGGGGFCGNGGNGGSNTCAGGGAGGGGGFCGNGGNGGLHGGGGGGGFFSNGGDGDARDGCGGGGGGFFSDGIGSSGGNGGVLIMYIKDDSSTEEA